MHEMFQSIVHLNVLCVELMCWDKVMAKSKTLQVWINSSKKSQVQGDVCWKQKHVSEDKVVSIDDLVLPHVLVTCILHLQNSSLHPESHFAVP